MTYKIVDEQGNVKWTLESIGTFTDDVIVLPKTIARGCSMTASGFDELFFDKLKTSSTHIEAYEKAEGIHESIFGKRRYKEYDSFRISKSQRLKNERTHN